MAHTGGMSAAPASGSIPAPDGRDDTVAPGPDAAASDARLAEEARSLVAGLTTGQKIALLSGTDFWNTEGVPGAAPIMVTDGPHGLRKQAGAADHVGLGDSVPATCFPTAVTLGSTWDPPLLEEVGAAIARECRAEDVAVLLGPGLNLKRHPGGGRNFEYFSEDPLLSGKSAAAMVRGLQSEGVGASVKHFAVNNQESRRMRLDTIVDERTLRELYLTGFEIAVTEGRPWTVMSAYNLVTGEHAGESRRLLTGILRDEWGFDGLVVSDWFAVADRLAGVRAGMDLEMPSSGGSWDAALAAAITSGELGVEELDRSCARVIELLLCAARTRRERGRGTVDADAHHALARRAAAAGTVLLRNDGLLPLAASGTIAVIGAFAERPRYQGAGSSQVNPTRLDTALERLRARVGSDAEVTYAAGYDPDTGETTPELLARARAAASAADVVVLCVGLPARSESEGFDRTDLGLPRGQDSLVEVVTHANPRTAAILFNGAPVEFDWADRPAAVVEAYLGGQAGGAALVDVLFGDVEPGGRLAESFPVRAAELPASADFASRPTQVRYAERLNVGYRFHDTHGVAPRFAFGHGLGYTTFAYDDLEVSGAGDAWIVAVTLTNTGDRAGGEVVQVYVHDVDSTLERPEQELRAFEKVTLEPGASARIELPLGRRAFAVYDVASARWLVEAGAFEVRVGSSSRDIRACAIIEVDSPDVVAPVPAPAGPVATEAEFARVLGRPVPAAPPLLPLTPDSGIDDLGLVPAGRPLRALVKRLAARGVGGDDDSTATMMDAVIGEFPLRGIVGFTGGRFSHAALRRLLRVLNLGRR